MKKIILVLCFVFGALYANAQTYKYYSTYFAYKAKNDYSGYWSDWSDWQPSRCLITISTDRDVINIYSSTPQEFDIYEYVGDSSDPNGETAEYRCVDADGLRCHVRIRRQNDGALQLYVDYNDLIYVYSIERRN